VEKKNAFKNKFAMFEKKDGPSEEEVIKSNIVKASQGRRFDKQMKTAMADESMKGMSPMAMEMALRAKIGNTTVKVSTEEESFEGQGINDHVEELEKTEEAGASPIRLAQAMATVKVADEYATETTVVEESGWGDLVAPVAGSDLETAAATSGADDAGNWQEVTDENGTYFWNTVTNDTTYDKPACVVVKETGSPWTKVTDENGTYYWNVETNDTTFEVPAGYKGGREETTAGEVSPVAESAPEGAQEEEEAVMWTERVGEDGAISYFKTEEPGVTRSDRPEGTVLIAYEDGTMFQEEAGSWKNTDSGEIVLSKPVGGVTMIVEDAGGRGAVESKRWSTHVDERGDEYFYCSHTGITQYEKPEDL